MFLDCLEWPAGFQHAPVVALVMTAVLATVMVLMNYSKSMGIR